MKTLEQQRAHDVIVKNELKHIKKELKLQVFILFSLLSTIWGTYLVNNVLTNSWITKNLTIHPRHLDGLLGILVSPFVHLDLQHAIGCSIGLLFLGWWAMMRDTRDFILVHIVALLTSGLAMWCFELSASRWFGWGGVLLGMAGYLLTTGIFERRWPAIISSTIAIVLFGLPVLGVLAPGGGANSWVGCAGGLFGGVLTAAFLGWRRKDKSDPDDYLGKKAPGVTDLMGLHKTKQQNTDITFDLSSSYDAPDSVESAVTHHKK